MLGTGGSSAGVRGNGNSIGGLEFERNTNGLGIGGAGAGISEPTTFRPAETRVGLGGMGTSSESPSIIASTATIKPVITVTPVVQTLISPKLII
jgi:hypothetical protein